MNNIITQHAAELPQNLITDYFANQDDNLRKLAVKNWSFVIAKQLIKKDIDTNSLANAIIGATLRNLDFASGDADIVPYSTKERKEQQEYAQRTGIKIPDNQLIKKIFEIQIGYKYYLKLIPDLDFRPYREGDVIRFKDGYPWFRGPTDDVDCDEYEKKAIKGYIATSTINGRNIGIRLDNIKIHNHAFKYSYDYRSLLTKEKKGIIKKDAFWYKEKERMLEKTIIKALGRLVAKVGAYSLNAEVRQRFQDALELDRVHFERDGTILRRVYADNPENQTKSESNEVADTLDELEPLDIKPKEFISLLGKDLNYE